MVPSAVMDLLVVAMPSSTSDLDLHKVSSRLDQPFPCYELDSDYIIDYES